MPLKPRILDNTLREGVQVPGVAFTPADQIRIALALAEAGVDMLDIGLPASPAAWRQCAELSAAVPCRTGVTIRAREEDLQIAAKHGVQDVFALFPCSEIHLEHKFRIGETELWRWVERCFAEANRLGIRIHVVAEDSSRASERLLRAFARHSREMSAASLYLCDTVGVMTPMRAPSWCRAALDELNGIPLGVHAHNDFGMAVANTVAAIAAGADWASVTVNGLGERAGNASTLEVATALKKLLGAEAAWDLSALVTAAMLVERCSGIPMGPLAPLSGWNAFQHESGIHVDGVIKHARAYEPIEPHELGRSRRLVFGTTSGRAHLRALLDSHGAPLSEEELSRLAERLRQIAYERAAGDRTGTLEQHYRNLEARILSELDVLDILNIRGDEAPVELP